jgi:hypothetical protein
LKKWGNNNKRVGGLDMNNSEAAGYALLALNRMLMDREMMPTERRAWLREMDSIMGRMFDMFEEKDAEAQGINLLGE